MTTGKRYWHLFVNDEHVNTVLSGWPCSRIMAQLRKKYPDAKVLEVRSHEQDTAEFLLKAR